MTFHFPSNCKQLFVCLFVAMLASFSYPSVCGATVNKDSVSVVVRTTDRSSWYNLSNISSSFLTSVICDNKESTDSNKYYNNGVCNADGKHNDYLMASTKDEREIYPISQNFSIKASASASSGSITAIKIEWMGELDRVAQYQGAEWTSESSGKGNATCYSGNCTFCVEGGDCDYPVIPHAYLGIKENGSQRQFSFRISVSSSTGDTVTTGYDPQYPSPWYTGESGTNSGTLDKYYSLVICGPGCGHDCKNYTPSVTAQIIAPSNFCNKLNDNNYYMVKWNYTDILSRTTQTYYKVSVRKKDTMTTVGTSEANSDSTSFKVPSSWLAYDTAYQVQIQTKVAGQGCEWTAASPWRDFNVPAQYPTPSFHVGYGNVDCVAGGCLTGNNLKFNAGASKVFTGNPSYYWTVEGEHPTGVSFYKTFTEAKSYTATLKVTDGDSHACSISQTFTLKDPDCAKNLSTSLSSAAVSNSCQGLGSPKVSWVNKNLPTGAKQTHYEVTVWNKNNNSDTFKIAADSASTFASIPANKVAFSSEYIWQVKVKIVSADGKCTWDLTSPQSTGTTNLVISAQYPTPSFHVGYGNVDCVAGGCLTGNNLKFNAGASKVFTGNP
ncbi:MAG: hypothetical protein PHF34_03010, partial [Bacteroidales bacterium]|nr:hypothetical protein [Bacteroidales bacterium]